MYSSRRRYYRKNIRRNLFSPSYRTGIPPTYTQMKGRVIRTTPLYDTPNQFPPVTSKEMLEQMKKILVDANYIPTQQFYSTYQTMGIITITMNSLSSGSNEIDSTVLQTLVDQNLALRTPPANTHWEISLMAINFYRAAYSSTDSSRFQFTWNSPVLPQEIQNTVLVDKSTDLSSYNGTFSSDIDIIPTQEENEALLNRVIFSQYAIDASQVLISTTDPDTGNNCIYPLVTTDSQLEAHGSKVVINITNTTHTNFYTIRLYVNCYILPN